jgi:hypothetical protein
MAWLLRTSAWVLLAGWLGSWGLFALVVAPTAFQVLPSHAVAGDLVSPVLGSLHRYGIAAGLGLGLLGWMLRRGATAVTLALVLAGVCAISEYGVTPAIAQVEPRAFGEAMEPVAAERFAMLHQTSRLLFGLVELGVLVLIGLHARSPGSQSRARPRESAS